MSSNGATRVAIITGATTGLGAATAELFARSGYRVLATALNDDGGFIAKLQAQNLEIVFFPADLRDAQKSARAIVERSTQLYGRIDVVVNCAARISHKPVVEVEEADWDEIFAVNLKAPFFISQSAFPHLSKTKGCIINISSTNAWRVNLKNQLYDSLKAALNHLTKGLALEFREADVRVNALMPGAMRTPLIDEWLELYLGRAAEGADLQGANVATPEMVAKVILGLATDEMRWINGAEIPVDGGYHLG